jgi:hypothetical protein
MKKCENCKWASDTCCPPKKTKGYITCLCPKHNFVIEIKKDSEGCSNHEING